MSLLPPENKQHNLQFPPQLFPMMQFPPTYPALYNPNPLVNSNQLQFVSKDIHLPGLHASTDNLYTAYTTLCPNTPIPQNMFIAQQLLQDPQFALACHQEILNKQKFFAQQQQSSSISIQGSEVQLQQHQQIQQLNQQQKLQQEKKKQKLKKKQINLNNNSIAIKEEEENQESTHHLHNNSNLPLNCEKSSTSVSQILDDSQKKTTDKKGPPVPPSQLKTCSSLSNLCQLDSQQNSQQQQQPQQQMNLFNPYLFAPQQQQQQPPNIMHLLENFEQGTSNEDDSQNNQQQQKKKKCKFDTKNLVKNFLNSFLSFVQSQEEESVVSKIMEYTEAEQVNNLRNKLKAFFKGKKFNRVLLKDFMFEDEFRPLFLFYLEQRAPIWIETGRMKDKASHIRALKNFTFVCQNYESIKSWRFRYNFV